MQKPHPQISAKYNMKKKKTALVAEHQPSDIWHIIQIQNYRNTSSLKGAFSQFIISTDATTIPPNYAKLSLAHKKKKKVKTLKRRTRGGKLQRSSLVEIK